MYRYIHAHTSVFTKKKREQNWFNKEESRGIENCSKDLIRDRFNYELIRACYYYRCMEGGELASETALH